MATQGLILDIGILMGSQSQSIFMEQVENYPGARHLYNVVTAFNCDCGREQCPREAMQFMLGEATGGNRELAEKFLEASQRVYTPAQLKGLIHDFFHEHQTKAQEEDPLIRAIRRLGLDVREI